ncbi:MAG: hypothetical protein JW912_06110 [Sedimentisphaerales bacterium]|nr:hypothetical protein [Sedimentisphaerales bacterium]
MEKNNCLGIHLSNDYATIALVSESDHTLSKCSSILIEPNEGANSIASAISKIINEQNLSFSNVAVSIDCSMYIQHDLHSEFSDNKQIEQTIKFDAEEAVAADATELAITFSITGTDPAGSTIAVFTANREKLNTILNDLQQNNLDPIFIEPDIAPIQRLLQQKCKMAEDENPIFAIFSNSACYLINLEPTRKGFFPIVRSFLVAPSQDKNAVLIRQLPVTMADIAAKYPDKPITSLLIAGNTQNLDMVSLANRTGLKIDNFELTELASIEPEQVDATIDKANLFAAFSAALTEIRKTAINDFRKDFNPYQGRKLVLQKTLRTISISVTVLMLALGAFFQIKVMQKSASINELNEKLAKDFAAVMFGKKPPANETIASRLGREYNRTLRIKSGQSVGDESSVTARLTFVFEAINNAPADINLKISIVSITNKTVSLIGDTNGRKSTLALFKAIKEHPKLKVSQQNLKQSGSRDTFTITLEPK